MLYGQPPFQRIPGGPLPKMSAIADPGHRIDYRASVGSRSAQAKEDASQDTVPIPPAAIDAIKRCLEYRKEDRLSIPDLLSHDFLKPALYGELESRQPVVVI